LAPHQDTTSALLKKNVKSLVFMVLAPHQDTTSALLKKNVKSLVFMDHLKNKIGKDIRKGPHKD